MDEMTHEMIQGLQEQIARLIREKEALEQKLVYAWRQVEQMRGSQETPQLYMVSGDTHDLSYERLSPEISEKLRTSTAVPGTPTYYAFLETKTRFYFLDKDGQEVEISKRFVNEPGNTGGPDNVEED